MSRFAITEHMRVVHRRSNRHGLVTYVHPPGVHVYVEWDDGKQEAFPVRPATNCMASSLDIEPLPPFDDREALEAWLDG